VKETSVLWIFLARILSPSTLQTSILWRIDNTTALSHIRKEGGLKSKAVLEWAEKILLLAHQRNLRILPAFIPSEENLQADAASRFQSLPDWHLSPIVFRQIVARKGLPQVDLFASRRSAQLSRFFSWDAADSPESLDALCQIWDFNLAYLFPPIPLLRRVVKKLERSRGTFLLVTPFWAAQTWFASLQALHVVDVCRLPFRDDLIVDLTTGAPPPNLGRLHLVVWTILGGVGELAPSQMGPSLSSRQGGSDPQRTATKELGGPSSLSSALPLFHSVRRL
jgi:hypothetical protein